MAALPEIEISPLDKIRQTEAEAAGALAAARETAEKLLADARADAKRSVHQADEDGKREGQAQYKEVLAQAEEEAATIINKARILTKELRRQGQQRMETGVEYALSFIAGIEIEDVKEQ